jgi:hypothetical protein
MPRNLDVMTVCDELEHHLTGVIITPVIDMGRTIKANETIDMTITIDGKCSVCEARRAADRARTMKFRKRRQKAKAND